MRIPDFRTVIRVPMELNSQFSVTLKDGRGQFSGVHNCPRSPADVPDTDDARLVVLDPTSPPENAATLEILRQRI